MAASIPPDHHYSDYNFSSLQINPADQIPDYTSLIDNYASISAASLNVQPYLMESSCDMNNSSSSFSEQQYNYNYGVSDFMVVPDQCDSGFRDFHNNNNYQQLYYHHHVAFEPEDHDNYHQYCSGLMQVPSVCVHPITADFNHGARIVHEGKGVGEDHEEKEQKVGRYSVEERKERILRYLKKRHQRNFNKTIKYACRKTLADKRIRIRGRFAKNSSTTDEPSEEDEIVINASTRDNSYSDESSSSFYEDSTNFQMKYDEEEWFQAAMANLMHLPYTPT